MAKFGRRYLLKVQGQFLPHTILYPLTCRFDISQNTFAMANTAEFSLYGLSESNRKDIYFDTYYKDRIIPIEFYAGYESDASLPLLFSGNIVTAYTTREGSELVTHISALDGGFGIDTGTVPSPIATVPAGWDFVTTVTSLMNNLPGVVPGIILLNSEVARGRRAAVFNGKTWNILQYLTPPDTDLFISNGVVNMLGQNNVLPPKGISELSADSGLLNIPIRQGFTVTCQSLFQPNFVLSQSIHLTSQLSPWINGTYKIIGMHHSGVISGVESGEARSDLSLLSSRAVAA